jgi:PAS domain S-box-containing protein
MSSTDLHEAARLKALQAYHLLDTPPEESFDRLTSLAAAICDVPISLVSLVDVHRQWFKSKVGLAVDETPIEVSFCKHAIAKETLMIVEDATKDHRFASNTLVTGEPSIRFYAGYPLIDPQGHALGTLCVIDRKPRKLTELQKGALKTLAEEVMYQIKARQQQLKLTNYELLFSQAPDLMCITDLNGHFLEINPAFTNVLGWTQKDLEGKTGMQFLHPDDLQLANIAQEVLFEQSAINSYTARFQTKNEDYKTLEWTCNLDKATRRVFAIVRDVTELRIREEAIQAQNQQLAALAHDLRIEKEKLDVFFETTLDLLGIVAPEGTFVRVNAAWEELLGYTSSQLVGKHFVEFVHPDDLQATQVVMDDLGKGKRITNFTNRFRSKNGEYRNLEWRSVQSDSLIYGAARDITEQVQEKEALKRVTRLLNDAQRLANMGGWELNVATGKTYWTDEVYAIHQLEKGFDHNQLNGIAFYHPDDQPVITKAIAEAIGEQKPFDVVCKFITAKGKQRWVRASGNPVIENGKTTRLIGMFQDITHQKEVEDTIRQAQHFSDSLINNLPVGFALLDRDLRQAKVNKAFIEMTGFTEEDLLAKFPPFAYWPEEELENIQQAFEQTTAMHHEYAQFELVFKRKNGERFQVMIHTSALKDHEGNIQGFFAAVVDVTDLKQAEAEAKREKKLLRTIIDNIPLNVYVKDLASRRILVNKSECQFIGLPEHEILGKTDRDLFPEAIAAVKMDEDQQVTQDKVPILGRELLISRKGLPDAWVMKSKIPLLNDQGELTGLVGISLNITERVHRENELRRTKEFLDQTSKMARVGGWEVDIVNKKVFWTEVTKSIHETAPDYQPSLEEAILFYKEGEHRQRIQQLVQLCMEQGQAFDEEFIFVTAKGHEKWVRAIGKADFKHGVCKRIYGTFQDIDQQKRLNEKIVKNEKMLQTLASQVEGVLYQFQLDTEFRAAWPFLSEGTMEIYEVTPLQVQQQPDLLMSMVHPDDQEKFQNKILSSFQQLTLFASSHRIVTPSGKEKWIAVAAKPEKQPNGSVVWSGYIQDVTWQKETERKLVKAKELAEAANVAKSDFLANMSHEIRTPLNSVVGFSELLMRTQLNDTQKQYMQSVHQSANVLLDLINDILDFSKIEAGKLELSPEKTDLWELASQVTDMVRYKANEKQLELLLHLSPQLPRYATLDAVRLKQVLINLLSNATKFTEKGEIEISIEPTNTARQGYASLHFAVRDTGIGIAPDKQTKIFEAFSQEDSSTTRKYGGTGLGLTISNKLLGLMHSRLELESQAGVGSTFSFTIEVPAEQGEPEFWEGIEAFTKILVVDDNENNGRILKEMLNMKGIATDIATNGIFALDKLSKHQAYDAVIIDYHMPFMDGLEVVRQIRKQLHLSAEKLPVVLLHSAGDDSRIREAMEPLQINVQLNKPITFNQLFGTLARLKVKPEEPVIAVKPMMQQFKQDSVKVLIADDNPLNTLLAKTMVATLLPNAEIIEAEDGQKAIDLFFTHLPDITLLDVQMPVKSGYEATREIRQRENGERRPIVALTAGTVKGEKERCLEAGMDDYLSKPIMLGLLKETLLKWILNPPRSSEYETESLTIKQQQAHFNREGLLERVNGNQYVVEELVAMLKDRVLLQMLNKAHVQWQQPDENETKIYAHTLKGAASGAGLDILADFAAALEVLSPWDVEQARGYIQQIVNELQWLLNFFKT